MTENLDEDDTKALEAIRVLTDHLAKNWISEGCRTHPNWGCVSCQAVELERQLNLLAYEIRANAGIATHVA